MLWSSAAPRAPGLLSFTTCCHIPVVLLAIVIIRCFRSHFWPRGLSSRPSAEANKAPPSDYNLTCGLFTHLRGRQSSRWQKVAQSFRTTSLSASWTGRPAGHRLISPALVILPVFTQLSLPSPLERCTAAFSVSHHQAEDGQTVEGQKKDSSRQTLHISSRSN